MVARLPDKEAIMPSLILRLRANQFAEDPESEERMQRSGSRGDNSEKTFCGLIGFALSSARASITFHHCLISFSSFSRQERSCFRFKRGIKAFNVSLLSPSRLTSIG